MNLQQTLASVRERLQTAVELELATIPPYLTALFSIQPGTNGAAARIIRSVMMEEMLHMLLAGNVLTAVGGQVKLGQANTPAYPLQMSFKGQSFKNRQFDIDLAALSIDSIDVFMQIELPDNWPTEQKARELIEIPGYTIGEFYNGIKNDLKQLCDEFGEQNVFTGKKENQLTEEYFWRGGGAPIIVTNMETASQAIDLIVEQGEGASAENVNDFFGSGEVPHYFRFGEIYYGRFYQPDDDPYQPPTGDILDVNYNAVYPIKKSCKSSDFTDFPELAYLNNLFNVNYTNMLQQLEEGFNGNPPAFYTAILNGMHKLTPIAYNLVQMPIPGDPQGRHAAPSFEWNLDTTQVIVKNIKASGISADDAKVLPS